MSDSHWLWWDLSDLAGDKREAKGHGEGHSVMIWNESCHGAGTGVSAKEIRGAPLPCGKTLWDRRSCMDS